MEKGIGAHLSEEHLRNLLLSIYADNLVQICPMQAIHGIVPVAKLY